MLSPKNFSEDNTLFTELTAEEAADINGGGWFGAVVGAVAGGVGGFFAGGPLGAVGGALWGAAVGHAIERGEYCSGGAIPQGDCN